MNGYVIRREHIDAGIEKAAASERRDLQEMICLVLELDELERSLPERVASAKEDAGTGNPPLSTAANEAVGQSADAAREIDRLLTRKCNRAETAKAVVEEILMVAKSDMKAMNALDNLIPADDPTKSIYSELYSKRREFVERLREFIV